MSMKHGERHEERKPAPAPDDTRVEGSPAPPAGQAEATGSPPKDPVAEGDPAIAELIKRAETAEARYAELAARAATLDEEVSSLKDQYLRKLADYENFRKRMFRENEDARKFGITGLLGDLIPVLDDFDRGVASAEHARDYTMLHDGIIIIRRQLGSLLENRYGLSRFESTGHAFDPNIHEAVAMEPGPVEEAMVSEEFLPGYRLHDRVIRAAKVRVRMPASPAPAGEPGTIEQN